MATRAGGSDEILDVIGKITLTLGVLTIALPIISAMLTNGALV